MAKSGLQKALANVDAASSAFLLSDDAFAEGDSLTVRALVEMFRNSDSESGSTEEPADKLAAT